MVEELFVVQKVLSFFKPLMKEVEQEVNRSFPESDLRIKKLKKKGAEVSWADASKRLSKESSKDLKTYIRVNWKQWERNIYVINVSTQKQVLMIKY